MPSIIFFDKKLVVGPNGPKEKIFERADAHKKINIPSSPTLKKRKKYHHTIPSRHPANGSVSQSAKNLLHKFISQFS